MIIVLKWLTENEVLPLMLLWNGFTIYMFYVLLLAVDADLIYVGGRLQKLNDMKGSTYMR